MEGGKIDQETFYSSEWKLYDYFLKMYYGWVDNRRIEQHFSDDIFKRISETADELGLECYVVGGYVRDIFLQRPSKDIDVVVVGSGIEMAEALGKRLGVERT